MVGAILLMMAPSGAMAADRHAVAEVRAALAAQGGEAKLRAVKSVAWDAVGYRNQIEQSERPEGPYITEFNTSSEIHDLAGNRFSASETMTVHPAWTGTQSTVVADGVAMQGNGASSRAGSPDTVVYARERVALSPERLLLTALDAPDLARLPDTLLQSVPHHVVRFTLDGAPVTVFLNANTHLPTAWDYSGPLARRGFWRYGGDVTTRTYWSFWWLARGGIHLPMQWTTVTNGQPDRLLSIKRLAVDGALDETKFLIPAAVRAAYRADAPPTDPDQQPLGTPKDPAVEIRPGIVLIPGSWNVTIVRQDDGLVILEAPIASGYSAKIIAEARRRYPGVPIKAVVTTSDSWPHIAGIREYVAQGVPVYALGLNRPILDRWIAAPRTSRPDSLSLRPRAAQFRVVASKTVIGSGANRIELYPIRGETSERQMMAYFPQHKLLYGSDPFQRDVEGRYFLPQMVGELTDAAAREKLRVDTFFMMHMGATPWAELPKALSEAVAAQTPDGTL